MEERNVFQRLRIWLVCRGFSLRVVYWVTGVLAFFISPLADNLTTALIMGAVAMAVGGSNTRFIALACINIVVAANAGGAFSPFGDITTLMVWQKGVVEIHEFLAIFFPSVVNWLIPAVIMNFAVGNEPPEEVCEIYCLKIGAKRIVVLFLVTIATAVVFHNYLNLPPACGMMLGLGYLGFFSFWLKQKELRMEEYDPVLGSRNGEFQKQGDVRSGHFDVMRNVSKAEWDTLLFFYGIIMCVGGLSQFGYLTATSEFLYHDMGATFANVMVGVLSAVMDNIPVMYAVLTMQPEMAHGQWLLVTLTAGVGGSLLSIGSAAGVALMGSARDIYTFGTHLRWTWAIALGYAGSILCHIWLNSEYF
jgi:Na+/H+ antiporter NhaD/arsenite permease-like protein